MTKTVTFYNDGEIDVRAIKTFGVSVKSDSAIGFFGTGMKMAISVILRHGGSITVWSGLDKYEFSTIQTEIRGKLFDIITMNGEELGFTTENAKTWEPWMAVREILCNAIDENGSHTTGHIRPSMGKTVIEVTCSDFYKEYIGRKTFMIEDRRLLWKNEGVEIYDGETKDLFYRGVKVHTFNKPCRYTYNIISSLSLTEDRTLKFSFSAVSQNLAPEILKCDNQTILTKIAKASKSHAEFDFDFYMFQGDPQPVREIFSDQKGKLLTNINESIKKIVFPDQSAELYSQGPMVLSKLQELQLNKAIKALTFMGLYDDQYELRVLNDLGLNLLGLADRTRNVIYLDKQLFAMGTKQLAACLYEEFIHLRYRVDDYTRDFQDHVINDLMTACEVAMGDPL